MQMIANQILIPPTLNLSAWFNLEPSRYREELRNLSANGNWDSWITFFCEAIIGQSKLEVIRINELLKFSDLLILDLKKKKFRGAVITIATSLIEDPYFTIASASKKFNVAFSTINNATQKLVDLEILKETTGKGYERIFMCPGVLQILEN
jgi:Fic family protein